MNDDRGDLWQGGPWERSNEALPALPAVHIPEGPGRPVLRPRRRGRRWPWFVGLLSLILAPSQFGWVLFWDYWAHPGLIV